PCAAVARAPPTSNSDLGFSLPMAPDCRCRPDGASARPSTTASRQRCSLGASNEVCGELLLAVKIGPWSVVVNLNQTDTLPLGPIGGPAFWSLGAMSPLGQNR